MLWISAVDDADAGYDEGCGDADAAPVGPGHARAVSLSSVRRPGVVLPVRPDPRGTDGPTPAQARGPRWRRVAPAHYVPVGTDSSALDQRIVEAMAGMPDGAAVTGWASLGWRRAPWFHGRAADGTRLDVPVAVDRVRGVRRRPGVELSEDWLFDGDIESVDGLRVTRAERSVSYEVCRARTLTAAVRTIDMAAAADLVDLASLERYGARSSVGRGSGCCASRSPPPTRTCGRRRRCPCASSGGERSPARSRPTGRCSTCPADTC